MLPCGFVFPPKGTSERRPLHSERHHRHQGSSLSAAHRPPDAGEAVDQEQRGQQRAAGLLLSLLFVPSLTLLLCHQISLLGNYTVQAKTEASRIKYLGFRTTLATYFHSLS